MIFYFELHLYNLALFFSLPGRYGVYIEADNRMEADDVLDRIKKEELAKIDPLPRHKFIIYYERSISPVEFVARTAETNNLFKVDKSNKQFGYHSKFVRRGR